MPIYVYRCAEGHTREHVRRIADRDNSATCEHGHPAPRLECVASHVPPDGIYSYAPNTGDPDRFERQRHAIKTGTKVIPRQPDMPAEARDGQLTSRKRASGY